MNEVERLAQELGKVPEQCVHCGQDVVFIDETECWFGPEVDGGLFGEPDGYHCPDAPEGEYGIRSHEV